MRDSSDLVLKMPSVMLSSTVMDLRDIRQRAHRVCRKLQLDIVSMDDNVAMADSARTFSIELVDNSDLYIGIVAQSPGSKPVGDELRFTHLEYERALKNNLPRLLFLARVDDEATLDDGVAKLRKKMLEDDSAVAAFFDDAGDFEERLRASLVKFIESWREDRGFNPDQAEFLVEPVVLEQYETVDVSVIVPDEVLRNLSVRFLGQAIELDGDGYGSAVAPEVGTHKVELIIGSGDDETVVGEQWVTVARPAGHLDNFALLGAFFLLCVWFFIGFSHHEALNPPEGAEPLHFRQDLVGHILTIGTLIGVIGLRFVWRRVRRGLGEIIVPIDEKWRSLRWGAATLAFLIMALATYLNVAYIVRETDTWWWSQDAGRWAPWVIAVAYFMLTLWPALLVIVRMGLALASAMQAPTRVLTFDPANADGHFGLAWLGNTMFGFLFVASVPLSFAANLHFATHEDSGLGIPITITLGTLIIGLLGAYPLTEAYPRLESQRHRARELEKKKLNKLESMRESALTEREREDRSIQIAEAKERIQAIESASAVVMSRFGVACVVLMAINLMAFIAFILLRTFI